MSRMLPWVVAILVTGCGGAADGTPEAGEEADAALPAHNTLTAQEEADGWRLLFDGRSMDSWRGYGREDLPESWVVDDGTMTLQTSGGNMDGGDIVTRSAYTDFELVFDFRVGPSGNSGVFYRVAEHEDADLWQVAPEYQVLDDPAYPESESWDPTKHRTGDNYDLHPAASRIVHPVGEWNTGRIVVRGDHVEHWLNGRMTVEYELYSDEWEALVGASKFGEEEHYARAPSGSIGLQDHGTPVWYRNMKLRPLGGGG